jgi:hypothetical protein
MRIHGTKSQSSAVFYQIINFQGSTFEDTSLGGRIADILQVGTIIDVWMTPTP